MHAFPNADLLSESLIDLVAGTLTNQGFIVVNEFLPVAIAEGLLIEVQQLPEYVFKPAAIGREDSQQLNAKVRSNTLYWLNGSSLVQQQYLAAMEQLRVGLNRRLFMGLFDFESHYSHYAPGDFYKRHVDAFKGSSNRVLSTVMYLNTAWNAADEGELILYKDESTIVLETVIPKLNNCVIFLSDRFPHEVKVTQKDRFCIAGWYRVNNSLDGQLDPPR